MGWSIGYDPNWSRDIGYGVPAYCDHPKCNAEIDRGLSYVCGDAPYGGDHGCGLFFCEEHRSGYRGYNSEEGGVYCPRCAAYKAPYKRPAPDHPQWTRHKLTDSSWSEWRAEHPEEVEIMRATLTPEEPRHE